MKLGDDEFIRRFLLHVLPGGFHRIRHYGLLATGSAKANLARARELLAVAPPEPALRKALTRCRCALIAADACASSTPLGAGGQPRAPRNDAETGEKAP